MLTYINIIQHWLIVISITINYTHLAGDFKNYRNTGRSVFHMQINKCVNKANELSTTRICLLIFYCLRYERVLCKPLRNRDKTSYVLLLIGFENRGFALVRSESRNSLREKKWEELDISPFLVAISVIGDSHRVKRCATRGISEYRFALRPIKITADPSRSATIAKM